MTETDQTQLIPVRNTDRSPMRTPPKSMSSFIMRLHQFRYMVNHGGLRETIGEMLYFGRTTFLLQARAEYCEDFELRNGSDNQVSFCEVSMENIERLSLSYPDESVCRKSMMYARQNHKGVFAVRKNEIVGYNWFVRHHDAERGALHPDLKWLRLELQPGEAYLFDLWIRPDVRGEKIGYLLAGKTLEILWKKHVTAAYVFAFYDNTASRKNLQKIGYREIRSFRSYRVLWLKWSSGMKNLPTS